MDLERIRSALEMYQDDRSLYDEANLGARAEALDLIALLDEIAALRGDDEELDALRRRARPLRRRLEAIDARLFDRLRAQIRAGTMTPQDLRAELDRYTDYRPQDRGQIHVKYDGLDVLVSGLLMDEPPHEPTKERTPEMIRCEPTPASVILELVDTVELTPDDVFYDLGAGLGQVVILVHLLTGVQARGIEYEPVFCDYARRRARDLGLSGVTFLEGDARDADYSEGTRFYMFTPFVGAMLQAVLDRLAREARTRAITLCAYGPCTPLVARQPWLRIRSPGAVHEFRLAVFESAR